MNVRLSTPLPRTFKDLFKDFKPTSSQQGFVLFNLVSNETHSTFQRDDRCQIHSLPVSHYRP